MPLACEPFEQIRTIRIAFAMPATLVQIADVLNVSQDIFLKTAPAPPALGILTPPGLGLALAPNASQACATAMVLAP